MNAARQAMKKMADAAKAGGAAGGAPGGAPGGGAASTALKFLGGAGALGYAGYHSFFTGP